MYRYFLPFLTNFIDKSYFPKELKEAEIISVYKKDDPLKKTHRPVSLLPQVSEIFERFIYKQINSYMCDKLSKRVLENVMERNIRY